MRGVAMPYVSYPASTYENICGALAQLRFSSTEQEAPNAGPRNNSWLGDMVGSPFARVILQ